MKRYEFPIWISGYGENIDDAWQDACESFWDDPGSPPDESECTVEEIQD